MKVNRQHRDVIAEAIRQFIEGELSLKDFEAACNLIEKADDPTVDEIVNELETYTMDLDDGADITFVKSDWDMLQRYLLVLDSDRHIQTTHSWCWSRWQLVALIGTVLFLVIAINIGFFNAFFWLSIPTGVLSYWISRVRKPAEVPYLKIIHPFHSFTALKETYESVRFQKMRYPGRRKVLDPATRWRWRFSKQAWFVFCLLFLPTIFVLPFQVFPRLDVQTKVV